MPHYVGGELVGTSRRYDERLTLALLAMPAPVPEPLDLDIPGSRYCPDDFRALLLRVEHGSERFGAGDTERARRADVEGEWESEWDEEPEEDLEEEPLPPDLSPWDE